VRKRKQTSNVARVVGNRPPTWRVSSCYLRFHFHYRRRCRSEHGRRATFAACSWIIDNFPGIRHFYLESNLATDKKASQINIMRTRGKRVTAEALIKREVLVQQMRVEPENLAYHYQVANIGSIMSGANNNGLHSAQCHYSYVYRHRPGCSQCVRIFCRFALCRADTR